MARAHRLVNKAMVPLLRSPLHFLVSGDVMLITFSGRKSGKRYVTPVTYVRDGDKIRFFSYSPWWKNLRGGAPVELLVRGWRLRGVAEPVEDRETVEREMRDYLSRKGPKSAGEIGWKIDPTREPTAEEFRQAALERVVVYVEVGQRG